MFANTTSAHQFGWFLMVVAIGLAGGQLAFQLLSLDRTHRRMLSAVLSGLVLGATAWTAFLLVLSALFPLLRTALPIGSMAVALPLCTVGAIGSMVATAYGQHSTRNILLAASLLAAAASCLLFVVVSGLTAPLALAHNLLVALGAMVGSTVLFGLGLRGVRRPSRALPALMFGLALPALNIASLACILPFADWQSAAAVPTALTPWPLTVVFVAELLAGLLLVRAGALADRRYAARVEQENIRLRHFADSAFEGILVHRAGVVLDANTAFCTMVGLPVTAIVGCPVMAFAPEFASSPGAARAIEVDLRRGDGSALTVEALSRELELGDGAARVTAVRDISERRAAELEARERRREADELRERARIAAETSRAKSTFLAMMSHEIRTPMNTVLGLATVLLDDTLTDSQRTMASAIHASAASLLRLLNDILDFSRLDAGRMTFESIPFSPAALTAEAVAVHGPAAMAKGLHIGTDIGADLPAMLVGDAGRLRQVLYNLVSNAVKFTEAGEIVVGLRCLTHSGGAARMQWEVRDSGIGVAADKLGQLFVEFTQADESIARRFGGSGLGLAISRRIIEQMGGEIQVESRPGEGSTFRFDVTLPQAAGPALETPAPRTDQPERFRAALRRLGRPMRVLLAEDNTTNQFVVKLLLRGFDVVIDTVGDGRAALNSASTASYDAICMDMLMPEMDGLQATRAIRDLGGQAATMPIIAMTANAFAEDIQACMEAGMTHFVAKPVSRDKLLQALEDALAAPPLARAA